ncbi:venom metalloproteinase 3-like [Ixodes scapularis]|uniref:venom metalloproteinase 3-like n=1 Tax=Ixodes scapularis TaxID=6945 RepID=UPI001A9F8D5B|nr:venom metalloproteinase 3-like [Ixodes scapularis]
MKIVTIFSILHTLSGVSLEDAIVFPRLLEERTKGGKQIVLVKKDLRLELQKASILSESVLIRGFFGENMEPRLENGTELEKNLYEDKKKLSTVIMTKSEEGITLKGILNEELKIEPLLVMQRISGKGIPHRISQIELPALNISSKSVCNEHFSDMALENVSQLPLLENRQDPPLLAVACEIIVLLDSVYGIGFSGLFEYLLALMTAVKLRFSLMNDPIVTLRVVGIYRLTSEEESLIFSYSFGYVLAVQSIRKLYMFLNQRPVFGGPDMFYMFLGRDLASINGNTLNPGISGISYYGVMCAFNNVAMGMDKPGTYQGVRVTTHELGHAFSCVHDGEGPIAHIPNHQGSNYPACAWEEGYVMSYIEKDTKAFHFSPCCKQQMKVFFKTLSKECLAIKYEYDYFTRSGGKLPGDNFNGNSFCKAQVPSYPNIFYPQPQKRLDLLKCKVKCMAIIDAHRRYLYFDLSAPDGLPCYGQNATCKHGECRFW